MIKGRLEVSDVVPLIWLFAKDEENIVGGNLHIYLSDGNIENEHIKFCMAECLKVNDWLGFSICSLSLKMSRTQRKKLVEAF